MVCLIAPVTNDSDVQDSQKLGSVRLDTRGGLPIMGLKIWNIIAGLHVLLDRQQKCNTHATQKQGSASYHAYKTTNKPTKLIVMREPVYTGVKSAGVLSASLPLLAQEDP
eukprot:738391-Pyramimonas_sp.AAC.1